MPTITINITEDAADALAKTSAATGLPESRIVDAALREMLTDIRDPEEVRMAEASAALAGRV